MKFSGPGKPERIGGSVGAIFVFICLLSIPAFFPIGCSKPGKDLKLLGVEKIGRLKDRSGEKPGGRFGLKYRDMVCSIACADFNRDGLEDIALAGPWSLVFFRNLEGKFQEKARWDWSVGCAVKLKAGDLDGDGDTDLVAGTFLGMDEKEIRRLGFHPPGDIVWLNPLNEKGEEGAFTGALYSLDSKGSSTKDLDLGDIDGDGDLDLVELNRKMERSGYEVLILSNNGNGRFSKRYSLDLEKKRANCIELADGDNDGDLDLFVGMDGPNHLFLNEGGGKFVLAERKKWPTGGENTLSLATGDIDGDGIGDIVEGNGFPESENRVYLFRQGRLRPSPSSLERPVMDDTVGVLLKDMDGKNGLDIVVLNLEHGRDFFPPSRVLVNDGKGVFRVAIELSVYNPPECCAALDLDGDGMPDLLMGCSDGLKVFLNEKGQDFFSVW